MRDVLIAIDQFKAYHEEELRKSKSDDFTDGLIRALQIVELRCTRYPNPEKIQGSAKDVHKLVDGTYWLVNTYGIHPCYQSQATHVARNNRLVPIGHDDPICSIPQELVVGIRKVLDWKKGFSWGGGMSPTTEQFFDQLEATLNKALQGQCEMHQSLQRRQELEEAEAMLIKVCEGIEAYPGYARIMMLKRDNLNHLHLIPRLPEWWAKHKPKSEREQKLEKIACALSLDGKSNPDFLLVAERVLKALGE